MKKVLSILLAMMLLFSCSVTSVAPSRNNIGLDRVHIENCSDTLRFEQLDSTLRSQQIHPIETEWTTMRYYDLEKGESTQFVYTKKDTTYIISKINNTDYVFIKRYLNTVK